jgi:excisionase family DNA binding protein
MYIGEMNKVRNIKQATESDYFTVDEAANELRIKPTAIRNYLCDGKFTTYKFKTLTLVHKEEVEAWKQRQK